MADYRQELLYSARAHAYDDYLAALFSPVDLREDMICLSAYYGEIARIPLIVKEEILAQIRFQWWRDGLEKGVPTGHPVADSMLLLKKRKEIPLELLLSMIDKRAEELEPLFFSNYEYLENYWKTIEYPHFKLRAFLLECPLVGELGSLLIEASQILGAVRLCLRLPHLVALGKSFHFKTDSNLSSQVNAERNYEEDVLEEFLVSLVARVTHDYSRLRPHLRRLKGRENVLFLPLSLVRLYLRVLQDKRYKAFGGVKASAPILRFFSYLMTVNLRSY